MGSVALFIPGDRRLPTGVRIEGKVSCCVCTEKIDQADVDNERVFFATGKNGIYPAHINHFYQLNPATGKFDTPTRNYEENLKLYAIAYGAGEGLATPNVG